MNEASIKVIEKVEFNIRRKAYLIIKRVLDVLLSMIALFLLSPVFLILIILIKIDSKGPSIFKQKRIGKNGHPIYIYKFRSMVDHAEDVLEELMSENEEIRKEYLTNKKLKKDPRITKIGNILRKTSLDELPQLLNILKGDMTIVGPRPYLYREIEDMIYYENIIRMTPGLTGPWQVNGRSNVGFRYRCELDNEYYKNRSLKTDIKIILKTVITVIKRDGAK